MNIEQKLQLLANESLQLRLELMIKDIVLFDYWQLNLLKHQIENEMETKKQILDDLKQDEERQQQIKQIQDQQNQIEKSKERSKRPRLRVERVGEIITRTNQRSNQ